MITHRIYLLGRFEACTDTGAAVHGIEARKVKELLSLLILSKGRPLQRERIADQLWPEIDARRSKKYLRQTLWQLQRALDEHVEDGSKLIVAEQEWIGLADSGSVWADVFECDRAYARSLDAPAGLLSDDVRAELTRAVGLFRGDLLEGWYVDWTTSYIDIYRSINIMLLDKLMLDAELRKEWELGLAYGRAVLGIDAANERAHFRMMRMHALAGDRSGALRQYRACAQALAEELDVTPEPRTEVLYALLKDGRSLPDEGDEAPGGVRDGESVHATVEKLRHLEGYLNSVQREVNSRIRLLELGA
ncbi:DNA-binding SARP family transcriptional activator [Nocardia tenerifensis]|uniref:DNA-binding SARP family transcriptional activator n=1 Tax=Nocardia tenerifensis TaxID=228006 RepID=A0A318KFE5_9NOCA|nr:BTAD domain-containing putative transcriptional regulator [Nocardia tenerifensis]PXX71559.1 DNA-binding SARP family transcriptional activator [Nocardia tenerifensis]